MRTKTEQWFVPAPVANLAGPTFGHEATSTIAD